MTTAPDPSNYVLHNSASVFLPVLGSNWTDVYAGRESVFSLLDTLGSLDSQVAQQLGESVNSLSRFTVPLFQISTATSIRLTNKQLTNQQIARYDQGYRYDEQLQYNTVIEQSLYIADLPADVARVPVIAAAGLFDSWVYFISGVDYTVTDGRVAFVRNPFDYPVAKQVTDSGFYVDFVLLNAERKTNNLYNMFGFLEEISGYEDSDRKLLNAVLNSRVRGYVVEDALDLISAATGVERVIQTERVLAVQNDADQGLPVVHSQTQIYAFANGGQLSNSDTLAAGSFIGNSVQICRPNKTHQFAVDGWVLPASFIKTGPSSTGDLYFENRLLDTEIQSNLLRTRIRFPVRGKRSDVINFWKQTHLNGLAEGKTFAEYLDPRVDPLEQPNAGNLPDKINPFLFLMEQLLHGVEFLCLIRLDLLPTRKRIHQLTFLDRIIDPDTQILILLVQADTSYVEPTYSSTTEFFVPEVVPNLTVAASVDSRVSFEQAQNC